MSLGELRVQLMTQGVWVDAEQLQPTFTDDAHKKAGRSEDIQPSYLKFTRETKETINVYGWSVTEKRTKRPFVYHTPPINQKVPIMFGILSDLIHSNDMFIVYPGSDSVGRLCWQTVESVMCRTAPGRRFENASARTAPTCTAHISENWSCS